MMAKGRTGQSKDGASFCLKDKEGYDTEVKENVE
jgi:hypothetical protein